VAAVDVLLPVRDARATLPAALGSIRAQSFGDFRCLILDDGSRDGSPGIASELAGTDPRFVLDRGESRGIAPTLNRGFRLASAPLVARMDADDLMEPDRLERQVALLDRRRDLDVASCRVRFFGDAVSENLRAYEAWLNSTLDHAAIVRDLFVESPLPHPSVTLRRSALAALGGYREGSFPEDYDLWLRGWRAGWRFGKCEETLVFIRDHERRLTKTDPRYTARAFLECKAEHLVASRDLAGKEVVVWGAGRDGKRLARSLRRRGVDLAGLVDVAPTKVGRRMLGLEVRPPESLAASRARFVAVAVGVKGAREEIRGFLAGCGYREGEDFACLG
jgi:glycosyltransferase involved in cell wall biosynthesis